jgi:LysR family nitrogen assimilation transcriptional regulator
MPTGPHISRHPLELEASRRGINLDITLEVDANDALFELVATGFAHTVSTQLTIRANLGSQKLVCQRIVEPSIGTNLYLVTPLTRNQTPLQLAAAEIAQTTFAKIATQL